MAVDVRNYSAAADDYDRLPYPSMPYAMTQPSRLAALAALHGVGAPPVETARLLEIGCASGGNIIPLAVQFPDARFVGFDLAKRHVDDADRRIRMLGLSNVVVRQGDIAAFDLGGETFDYVICHGVFSWVPKALQAAIFQLCQNALGDGGVAAISYNVLPGWHLRSAIRDICLRFAGADGAPQVRVGKVRQALDKLAAGVEGDGPYAALLRNEARRIAHRPASYILGEFLVAENNPCHVSEFLTAAERHGFSYLCDADLEAAVPSFRAQGGDERIATLTSATSGVAREQAIDDLSGRTFRCSVLRKGGPAEARDFVRLEGLHISADLRKDIQRSKEGAPIYLDARGRTVTSKDSAVLAALARLSGVFPATLPFAELVAPGDGPPTAPEQERIAHVQNALAMLISVGQASVWLSPLRVGTGEEDRPLLAAVARADAAAGQPWVTNLEHRPVVLKPAAAVLAPLLDGAHERAALVAALASALREGRLRAPEQESATDPEVLAQRYLARTLRHLARSALLLPQA